MPDKREHLGSAKKDVIFPVAPLHSELDDAVYQELRGVVVERIRSARLAQITRANSAMVMLYWRIGMDILERQRQEGWGARVIDRLSADLKEAFPEMHGFSPRNLQYMRRFAGEWPDQEIVQHGVAQIPWRANILLLEKLDTTEERTWYAQQTLANGWSSNILQIMIEAKLVNRQGKATTNFPEALPPPDSDMATQVFKDPYLFDFLGTDAPRREAEVEVALVDHMEKFLLELGRGFAFVGRQVRLELGDEDFYLDLLFYHLTLRCYVVIELKTGKFEPGFVSQLTMYQNVVDDVLRHPDDKPTIGLLLVKSKNETVAKYSLSGYRNPVGVAVWQEELTDAIPANLKPSLPTIEEIEDELG